MCGQCRFVRTPPPSARKRGRQPEHEHAMYEATWQRALRQHTLHCQYCTVLHAKVKTYAQQQSGAYVDTSCNAESLLHCAGACEILPTTQQSTTYKSVRYELRNTTAHRPSESDSTDAQQLDDIHWNNCQTRLLECVVEKMTTTTLSSVRRFTLALHMWHCIARAAR